MGEISVTVVQGPDNPQTQRIVDTGEYCLDMTHSEKSTAVHGLQFSGVIDLSSPMRGVIATPVNTPGHTHSIIENFLRLLVAYRLLHSDGLLLHSAAIVVEDKAYVFYGVSEAGKSTLSEMAYAAGCEVISDDLNAVLLSADGIRVRKLPFTGTFSGSNSKRQSYPLGGLYKLRKSEANEVSGMDRVSSLVSIMACCPFVNSNEFMLDRLQGRIADLLGLVDGGILDFSKTNGFDEIASLLKTRK